MPLHIIKAVALHIIKAARFAYHHCERGYTACRLMRYKGGDAALDDIHTKV